MTISNFNTIKAYVIALGGFTSSDKLDLQIKMIIDEILAYCYRDDVPPEMELPISDVIVTQINKIQALGGLDGNVTSYREGDMSINYASDTLNGNAIKYNGKLEGFKQIIGAIRCSDKTNAQ